MATENSGKSLLIVRYDWTLENVEKDFKTVASNLILFRGERVFRVALRHSGGHGPQAQTNLIFLAINLNKIGLRIVDVVCGMEGVDTQCRMNESKPRGKKENHSDEGGLQLFTSNVDAVNGGKCTFGFQIHLEGIVDGYSYYPCDLRQKSNFGRP